MFFRLQLPLLLTFVAGMIPIIAFFFTERATVIKWPSDYLERSLVIVAGFALLLGAPRPLLTRRATQRGMQWFAAVLMARHIGWSGAPGRLQGPCGKSAAPNQKKGQRASNNPHGRLVDASYG